VVINLDGKRWKNEAGMDGDISAQRDGVAMPMMMGGGGPVSVLEGESVACGGLGPAFLSGYAAGTYAAAYIEDL
jgi:hypothetical protein